MTPSWSSNRKPVAQRSPCEPGSFWAPTVPDPGGAAVHPRCRGGAVRVRLSRDSPHASRLSRSESLRCLLRRQVITGFLRLGVSARFDHQRWRRHGDQRFFHPTCGGDLRRVAGLDQAEIVRREGAPIPLRPLRRWDNGRDVLLTGDAAGVVAPASGEGIYYAMACGRMCAKAIDQFLLTRNAHALRKARKEFLAAHGRVFWCSVCCSVSGIPTIGAASSS